MKKVLLINTNIEKAPYPVPPLGLGMIAEHIGKQYEVMVFDGVFSDPAGLPAVVSSFDPDYVGFSIRNVDDMVMDHTVFYIDDIIRDFIEPVRRVTRAPLILGGSGFSIFPDELMRRSGADHGITGEGEDAFLRLLMRLDGISGEPETFEFTESRYSETDRKIDFTQYLRKGAYSIQTKRGCAHGCIYCTYPLIEGRTFRTRRPEDIADEIDQLYQRVGTATVEFVDSTFNDPAGHAEAICREIIRRKTPMRFRTMGINPRHTSSELFSLMREAGFVQVDVTPDTASPGVLSTMKKGFGIGDIERTARLIRESGIPVMWFFLFGAPGEDEVTVAETLDFIETHVSPEDMVHLSSGLRIYPGTPLHRIALKEGIVNPGDSLLFPAPFYFSPLIGKARLDQLLFKASRRLYNCIPAIESTPPAEMIVEAIELRKGMPVPEPMFRTLLRIRKRWFESGKLR